MRRFPSPRSISFVVVFAFVTCLFAAPRSEAQSLPLPLGSVTSITNVNCTAGFTSGSSCQHLIIHGCAKAIDLGVTIGMLTPAVPKSTIVLFTGSTGTRPTGGAFATDYLKSGYRVVDVAWDAKPASGWEDTGINSHEPANLLTGACRPATLLNYLEKQFPSAPFCAQGSSAGSSAIAFAVAEYGVTPPDAVEFIPGPVMSKVDFGCNTGSPTVLVNPSDGLQYDNNPQYVNQFATAISHFTGQPCPASVQNLALSSQDIVQAGANLSWPHTFVGQWTCNLSSGLINNSSAQAEYFKDNLGITAAHSLTAVSNCRGSEDVQNGTTLEGVKGQKGIETEMLAQCIRH
jgi:hypothetical protein